MATHSAPRFPRSRQGADPSREQLSFDEGYEDALTDDEITDWISYDPTRTINPARPRTLQARYSPSEQIIEIEFREGATYRYYDCKPQTWSAFKRTESPGRFINRNLNGHSYERGGFGD